MNPSSQPAAKSDNMWMQAHIEAKEERDALMYKKMRAAASAAAAEVVEAHKKKAYIKKRVKEGVQQELARMIEQAEEGAAAAIAETRVKKTIVVTAQDRPVKDSHGLSVQAPPRPDHPWWVSDPASLKKIYDRVQEMWAKSKKPKAARIAFEQEIIPFEEFEQFKMTLCAVQTGLDPIERQWVYYMGGKLPGKIELDFVIGIFPNTQVYTGVPLNVYYRRVGGSRLLGAEDGVWPTDRPVVVGEKRVREE